MSRRPILLASLVAMTLSGCVSTVASVVTAPIKVVGKAADWATTSQDEADRNRGRKLREREEELGRLARKRDRKTARCREGNDDACTRAATIEGQIDDLARAPL